MKKGEHEKVGEALYLWFMNKREKGLPVSGPMLQEKALQYYEDLEDTKDVPQEEKFTASEGWLFRWKKRYGIRKLKISGERLSAEGQKGELEKFKRYLHKLMRKENLVAEQVYNCDETGLYYRMLPDKTLAAREEKAAPGYKKSKDRVTVMACSNVTGDHKLPLVFIGKSKKPRAFKKVKDMSTLPVSYKNQRNAWMDTQIFTSWFKEEFVPAVTKFLKDKGLPQKAILLVDNAPCHGQKDLKSLKVGGIRVIFLPPNITSIAQPMDQGVLEFLKKIYRKQLLSFILSNDEEDHMVMLKKIDVLDVIRFVSEAWNQVEPITVIRSWRKLLDHKATNECWGTINNFNETENFESSEGQEKVIDRDIDTELLELLAEMPRCSEIVRGDINAWMDADDEHDMTDNDIIDMVNEERTNDPDENDDEEDETTGISHAEGHQAIVTTLAYMEQEGSMTLAERIMLRRWRDSALKNKLNFSKQKLVTDFFKKN
jgi:hypothetical protein